MEAKLELGRLRGVGSTVALPASALLRHLFAVGASGSGKTVLCKLVIEQAARAGVPAICIDPQGDLASIALADGELADLIDPVVYTPASTAGIAVCADPIRADDGEPVEAWGYRAGRHLVSLLGYDLASDDGDGLAVAFSDLLLCHRRAGGRPRLGEFIANFDSLLGERRPEVEAMVTKRAVASATRKLRRLEAPGRRALFLEGIPLDVQALLAGQRTGRTRIAIVYLNSLAGAADKELVVATLAERIYQWMLARPSDTPQLLFYVDEVAPFVPPVRKPACKDGLVRLLKQARKYGVGCLLASQNPGDIDYRALGQFGTWALGRLTTRQDLKKIEPSVHALAPEAGERVIGSLPRLAPGQFWLLSPDTFGEPVALDANRLEAPHRTLDVDAIAELADARWRARFEPTLLLPVPVPAPEPEPAPSDELELEIDANDGHAEGGPTAPTPAAERIASALVGSSGMRAVAIASAIDLSESHTRRHLRLMLDGGLVTKVRRGREVHYLWIAGGGRPDLELGAEVICARRALDPERAREIAAGYTRGRLFGLFGDREDLAAIEATSVPLYAIDYREPVRPGTLERLLGQRSSHLEGTVYFEPTSLELLRYSPQNGIWFGEPSDRSPTKIADLDGHVTFAPTPLAATRLDESRWARRRPSDDALERFRTLFAADPSPVRVAFLPLWRARYRQPGGGAVRVLLIDAIVGHPVEWPP